MLGWRGGRRRGEGEVDPFADEGAAVEGKVGVAAGEGVGGAGCEEDAGYGAVQR